MNKPLCDDETGTCILPEMRVDAIAPALSDATVYYVGDPMCSWCWGMAPEIGKLAQYCADTGLAFQLIMGGLRVGGGDPWNSQFKNFLRNEWQHIGRATGQPFGFTLLGRPFFNYDTEPAARAIAVVEGITNSQKTTLAFLAKVQRKFYVEGEDPKEVEFYRDLCAEAGLDFADFAAAFSTPQARQAAMSHFRLARDLGIRGFPSVVARIGDQIHQLSVGYGKVEAIQAQLANLVA